jgi:hypothetical protein
VFFYLQPRSLKEHDMRLARAMCLTAVATMFFGAATASAQERGHSGITMGFPMSVGFITHVSDRVALRPELHVSFSTSTTDSPFETSESRNSIVGAGFSALIYIGDPDKLRLYVSPRYIYLHQKLTIDSPFGTSTGTSLNSHTLVGSFGAQYSLHERFTVFGEVGVGAAFDRREAGLTPVRGKSTAVNLRSGVGVALYF